jgi:hypothetical protein
MKNKILAAMAAAAVVAAPMLGCSHTHTVMVPVPPRVDLKPYGTIGIVDFTSNGDRATSSQATRQFEEHVQEAQPGTRFLELGSRDAVLAGVGSSEFNPEALRRIGQKYGVKAVVLGEVVYSEPRTDIKVADITRLEGGMRSELRADISGRLLETASGASAWTRSSWTKRQLGTLSVSAERGVSGSLAKTDPREEMLTTLVYHLTHDFRPSTVRETRPD